MTPSTLFHLDIHAWTEAQQTAHGVRHDDYGQYHGYCTRRLAKLSHQKDAKQYLVHSNKYAAPSPVKMNDEAVKTEASNKINSNNSKQLKKSKKKSGGTRHAFCTRSHDTLALITKAATSEEDAHETVTTEDSVPVPHINILWYLLVSAERSWAHSNELQKSSTAKRQQYLKKMKRATEWAHLLMEKCKVYADSSTIKECEAYCAWMSANYAMEKTNYEEASQEYACAMTLCYQLSQEGLEEDDTNQEDSLKAQQLERQDLFVTRADTVLRPLFRYCQYELKQAGLSTMDEPRLASSSARNASKDGGDDTVVFREQELVLDDKQLRVFLLKYQSLEQELNQQQQADDATKSKANDETQFFTALSVLDDALEVVRNLENGLSRISSSGPAVQTKLEQYGLWKGYLLSTKTQKIMEHTERLLDEDGGMGPAEKVHVYDALLQHAKSLLSLPRPGQQGVGAIEEDEFALQAQANILRLRALKTYQMGWFYYRWLHKYAPALSLMEHSAVLSKRAEEEIAACDEDMAHANDYLKELGSLPLTSAVGAIRAAMALQKRQHARRLKNAGADSSALLQEPISTDRPLLLRLYELDGGTPDSPIADLRPMPIPPKPVFYDLAYDYALDPSDAINAVDAFYREHTIAPLAEEEEKDAGASGSGIFGWFSGSK
ncbi:MAG: hypothetical protein SGILL_001512 [Bacillariaceae sp.]